MRIHVVDSHTGGEPTRLIVEGGPDLGSGTMAERLEAFRLRHDHFRSAVVNEPRGSDPMVGALLCKPVDPANTAGVIFFNNVGYLGMCGHGAIGLITSLAWLGRIDAGDHRIETPVGVIKAELLDSGKVTIENVPSYRHARAITIDVEGFGRVTGDVAWGGNWFFLVKGSPYQLELQNVEHLTDFTWRVRQDLTRAGITGAGGQEIDHIELFDDSGRNFVLCPGKQYDRSPCGTGTSAKVACLYADGQLTPGQIWRQESILGSVFEACVTIVNGEIRPRITGSAYVNADAHLILDERDPFCWGIRPAAS